MRTCPDCLSFYKRSSVGKRNRKNGILWGKNKWPQWVYHDEATRKCLKHHVQSLADSSKRRAAKIDASPVWADRAKIKEIYKDCVLKSSGGKVRHEVDHIVPLRGKNVCGLHNEFNLQVITATDNRAKSNKF